MVTVSGTISTVSAGGILFCRKGQNMTHTITLGETFDGTCTLNESETGVAAGPWPIHTSVTASTSAVIINARADRDTYYRVQVALGADKETLTGNLTYSLVGGTAELERWTNRDGRVVTKITETGLETTALTCTGAQTITGDITFTGDMDFVGRLDTTMGANVTAASTIDLDGATGNYVAVTGNTGITAVTLAAGHWAIVKFTGTPELTHGASLVLPGSANITAAAGDTAMFVGEGSSVTKCLWWHLGAATNAGRALLDDAAASNQRTTLGFSAGANLVETHGADVASATTTNLTTATGLVVDVTGTTTITAITLAEGYTRIVRFTGILTLTNGASLVLPGGANITTAAGDYAIFVGYATGVVRCVGYWPIAGNATITGAETLTNKTLTSPTINSPTMSRPSQTRLYISSAKVGATAGWLVGGGAVNTGLCATLPAYLTGTGVNEVVTLTASAPPTQGTWKLTFGGQETASLAYNESAINIQTKFQALSTVGAGNATVAGTLATSVVITFGGTLTATNVGAVTVTSASTLASNAGTNERQDLTPGAAPIEGSYKVTYSGSSSAAIAFDALNAAIQSAVEAVPTIGAGNVTVGGTMATAVTLTFSGALAAADLAAVTVTDNTLHSDAGTAEHVHLTCGANAISGTTKLTFGGNSTANLNWNATAPQIETAFKALSGASNATVSGTFGAGLVQITFGADDGDVGNVTLTDNVLKSDAGTNEVQRLTCGVNAVSGTVKITYDGQTTAALAYNANTAAIVSALEDLSNVGVGDVAVTGGFNASPVAITFQGALAATNVAEVATTESTLKSDAGTNERQDLTPDGIPASGSYMVSYGGVWSTEIAWNDDAAAIQAHLETIPALTGNVTVGGAIASEVTVTFGGTLAATDVSALTVAEINLKTGAAADIQVVVSEHTKGIVPAAVVVTPSTVTPGVVKTPVVVTPSEETKGIAKANVTVTVSENIKGIVPALVTATPVADPQGSNTANTASTVIVPIEGLRVGDTITSFYPVAQIESAGNAVTLDADLRKMTNAAADFSDASIGAIAQVSKTADYATSATEAKTLDTPEVVAATEIIYCKLTGTTNLLTDIALGGVAVVVTEA